MFDAACFEVLARFASAFFFVRQEYIFVLGVVVSDDLLLHLFVCSDFLFLFL